MDDLISREALLKERATAIEWTGKELHFVSVEDIESTPSVDAVAVVRCKDCKHFKPTSEIKGECTYWRVMPIQYPLKEDYCARGERREKNEIN